MADQCCGGYCLPVTSPDGWACASACVEIAGGCSTDSDCCTAMICADGFCAPSPTACLPYASECLVDADCCSGFCDPTALLCLAPPST